MNTKVLTATLICFAASLHAKDLPEVKSGERSPTIVCELVGLTDDGKELQVKLHEPPEQRVHKLSGTLLIKDRNGEHLQMPSGHGFIPYPFDEKPALIIKARVTDGPKGRAFRKLVAEDPDRVVFSFQPKELTFDKSLPRPPRPCSVRESGKTTTIEYEMEDGDVVFTGLLKRRWGRSWVVPKDGRTFPADTSARRLRFVVEITAPGGEEEDEWTLYQGAEAPDTVPDDGQAWGYSMGGEKRVPMEPGEQRIPVRPLELPMTTADLDTYIIPYRVVSGETDCLLVAIAKNKLTIIDYVRSLPQERGSDWEDRFFPVKLPRQTEDPQDRKPGRPDVPDNPALPDRR